MRFLISGATGFVGTHLRNLLNSGGHAVEVISRRPHIGIPWERSALLAAAQNADVLVHLAGAGVMDRRWSAVRKRELVESRVDTTKLLAEVSAEVGVPRFMCASVVGIYGDRERSEVLDEGSSSGDDFLAGLCERWEAALEPARAAGISTASVRVGIVLGLDGGALKTMLRPFKFGLGGPVGDGRQGFPWIHVLDLVRMIEFLASRPDLTGPFNGVAPGNVEQREFSRTLGRVLHRPAFLPMPAFAVRTLFGERSVLLLTGQNVAPKAVLEAGFQFRFPELGVALEDLLGA